MKTNEELFEEKFKEYSLSEYPFTKEEWDIFWKDSLSRKRFEAGFLAACEVKDKELERLNEGIEHYISESSTWMKAAQKHYGEIKKLKEQLKMKQDYWIDACREIEKLKEQLGNAHEVIRFYADTSNWAQSHKSPFTQLLSSNDCDDGDGQMIGGKRARDYLKQLEQ